MAAFDFPNSPSTNQTHTENSVTWKWNGTVWKRQGVAGAQGAQGHQGVQGAAGSATISNNADDRVITGGSGTNLNGEANLVFNGARLTVKTDQMVAGQTLPDKGIVLQSSSNMTSGYALPLISATPNSSSIGRARAGIAAVSDNGTAGMHLALMTRYAADGTDLDVTADERVRISSGGKVGIATDNPYAPLSLRTAPAASNASNMADKGILLHSPGATDEQVIPISASFVTNAHLPRCAMGFISHPTADPIEGYAGEIAFYTHDAADGSAVNPAHERMRIDRYGSMGLGTNSPGRLLHIKSSAPIIRLDDSNGGYSEISANTAILSLRADQGNSESGSYINFQVDSSEKVVITDGGKLGIGHHSHSQVGKELTIRPANDGGIQFIRPGDTPSSPNIHLELTTTTVGSAFPTAEAYTVKYRTMNCDQIFETYEGGGTGGNISFRTSESNNQHETVRMYKDGHVTFFGSGPWSDPGVTDTRFFNGKFSMADDATVTLSSAANTGALICVGSYRRNGGSIVYASALYFITYGSNSVIKVADPRGIFHTGDYDGYMCMYKSSSSNGNVTLKNRLGVTNDVSVNIIGLQGL